MARPLRIEYPGAVYHITSRGNEKKAVFKDDSDRAVFLKILAQVNKRYNWICHAYCLMDNHYHLLIETPDGNLSIGMRQLNGVYTQSFNRRHRRTGHLFQGRYKAILIQKDSHLLEVCRYIVLNPVRARISQNPGAWEWSSYKATSGRGNLHLCLTIDWVIGQFSTNRKKAQNKYRQFVQQGIGKESIWTDVKAQAVLGEDNFTDEFIDYLKKHKDITDIPKSQRYLNRPLLEKIFSEDMTGDKRKRDKKIVEATGKYGYTQREVADNLKMHFTSVSRIIRQMVK